MMTLDRRKAVEESADLCRSNFRHQGDEQTKGRDRRWRDSGVVPLHRDGLGRDMKNDVPIESLKQLIRFCYKLIEVNRFIKSHNSGEGSAISEVQE
jgi:hypothetical protein